jgi:hypothetical protein
MLNQGHHHGPMEQIMDIVEQVQKGNTMNIKENYCIYKYEQAKELTEEQKSRKEETKDNHSILFEIGIGATSAYEGMT